MRTSSRHAPDRTPFAGIYQVPPGSYLLTDGQHVRVMPYWDWDYPAAADLRRQSTANASTSSASRLAFEEAVRLRLRADVPVACYLSGGIDSCAVLGVASRLSSRAAARVHALVRSCGLRRGRDRRRAGASYRARSFYRVDIRSEHTADHFADALYHAERPFLNAHCVAKYLLSRAVRDSGVQGRSDGRGQR